MSTVGAMSGDLRDHLRVGEVEEVDHPGGLEGDLPRGLGGADREGLEEVAGVAQGGSSPVGIVCRGLNGIALERAQIRQLVFSGQTSTSRARATGDPASP